MLSIPRAPAASWAQCKSRILTAFKTVDVRVGIAFWLFGLINNVLYVIILSAALDLVGPSVPKGVVLLADVLPSFLTKLVAPYFIHRIAYPVRVCGLVILSASGMFVVALTPASTSGNAIFWKMVGVMVASAASGGGELSFLSLTHYYSHLSLAAWSSGTGGAGIVGAGAYAIATTSLGLDVQTSLLAFAFLPVVMLVSFFGILPRGPLDTKTAISAAYMPVDQPIVTPSAEDEATADDTVPNDADIPAMETDSVAMLSSSAYSVESGKYSSTRSGQAWAHFKANLKRSRSLFFPYMLPLLLVYIAEYTINQGVAPTLLFPLSRTPFTEFREFYPTYNAIYQVGVFISRSSTPFFRIHHLYTPSLLQVANLAVLTLHALFNFIPNVYYIFVIIFWEGLLGGLVYVSTFAEITDNVPMADREFSLGATSVSDSGGVCIASFIGMVFEVWLCRWQVDHGRAYCTKR